MTTSMAEDTQQTNRLYGGIYVNTNPNANPPEFHIPETTPEEITVSSIGAVSSTCIDAGKFLIEQGKGATKLLKISLASLSSVPFVALDIAMSYKEEGIVQATVTAVAAEGITIAVGIGIVALASAASIPLTLSTVVLLGLGLGIFNYQTGKALDGIYDYLEEQFEYNYNEDTSILTLDMSFTEIGDIKTIINPLMCSIEDSEALKGIVINQDVNGEENTYIVKPGDTVWGIGQKYGLTPEEMKELNPWLADRFSEDGKFALIRPGENLIIPGGKSQMAQELADTFTAAEGAKQVSYSDPLILDLDGDGIETTTLENGVYFDHAVDGFKELSAWVGEDDGMLVLDKNQNGIIDDGSEIFGDNYIKLDGSKATSGFDALSDFDINGDGKITSDEFGDIRILKGDGSLLTLQDAGIQSINLSFTNKNNKKDDVGNIQKSAGTFLKTDGSTGTLGDFLFAYNSINTIPTDWVEVPEDIAQLPDIPGMGNVHSLHQAMTKNPELKLLIQSFTSAPDIKTRLDSVKQIIYKWADVDDIATDSRGPNYNGKDLAALEKFVGRNFVGMNSGNHQISPDPIPNAANILANCFTMLQEYIFAELEAQTVLKPLFEMLNFSYDQTSDKFLYDISPVQNYIDNAISANPTNGKSLLLDFAKTFVNLGLVENSNYSDFKEHFTALSKEYELLLSSIDKVNIYGSDEDDIIDGSTEQDAVFAYAGNDTISTRQGDDIVYAGDGDDNIDTCKGNDIIFGENGNDTIDAGDGDDYIDGGDGNDTIFSGKGDDTIIGGKGDDYMEDVKWGGNDTYIFNLGDGNDTIINWHGDDKIVFGEGISSANLKFIGDNMDIIIKFNDSPNDSIRIVNFAQYEDYRIETFEFADGSVLTANDVIQNIVVEGTYSDDIIYGTTLADTIYGFDGDDKIYSKGGADKIFAGAGNDVIYNSNGNDFIDPGDGDDKVYTSSKFDETILGSKGNDYFEDTDGGNETYIFSAGDGIDTIYNKFGDNDTVRFDSSVNKNNIALFVDNSNYLHIDYGSSAGADVVKIKAQQAEACAIENFEFVDSDGNISTVTNLRLNQIIQDMNAFAADNDFVISSVADVKNNPELLNLIANSIAA